MIKLVYTLAISLLLYYSTNSCFAQIYGIGTNNPVTNGSLNIGIGYNAPVSKLHINSNTSTLSGIQIDALIPGSAPVMVVNTYTSGMGSGSGGGPTITNLMTVNRDGSTQINGDFTTQRIESTYGLNNITLNPQTAQLAWKRLVPDDGVNFVIRYDGDGGYPAADLIHISKDGKVGIKTDNFLGDYSLYINGKSISEESVVKLSSNWPDYVFQPEYNLMGFEELNNYINEYNRLPGMPSALEVKENGLELGSTQALLLEKIEEMTLMILQLNERIIELENATELKSDKN